MALKQLIRSPPGR